MIIEVINLPPFRVVVDDTIPPDEMWACYQPDNDEEELVVVKIKGIGKDLEEASGE